MLTGNEVALAQAAVQLAMAWHREKTADSDFGKREIEKLSALNLNLDGILNWAYPAGYDDPRDGDEALLVKSMDKFGLVDGRAEFDILTGRR